MRRADERHAAQRMAVIEQAMKDSAGEYWKSPKLQDEYRGLLEAEDASGDHVEVQSLVGREDLADMPPDVIGNELMNAAGVTDKELETWVEWTGTDPASVAEGFANAKALWDGMEAVAGPATAIRPSGKRTPLRCPLRPCVVSTGSFAWTRLTTSLPARRTC